MARTANRPATYDDLLRVPPHLVAEIVEGDLHTSPRPASRHSRAAGRIFRRLAAAFEDAEGGPGGWWIVPEPELHLGRDVLVPDVAGWRMERVPEYPDVVAWTIAPDWICEVISPSTGRFDRTRKLPAYARHGVEYAWIVETAIRTIEVFRLDGDAWKLVVTHGGEEPANIMPFEAIAFPLATLWMPA